MENDAKGFRAIKRVGVIGAGVMGQSIAAHMVNAGIECILLDMPAKVSDRNQIVKDAIKKIETSRPSLLFSKKQIAGISIGNIEDYLPRLKKCDLIIEAVIEKLDIKQGLFRQLEKHLADDAII